MTKKVLIAVGGTGGHIYPALALAKKLKEKDQTVQINFLGGGLDESRYFERNSYPHQEIACGHFPVKQPITCLKSLAKVASGVWQSGRFIKNFNPNIVVGFGSYHSLPVLLAAKMHKIPIVLHEGNVIPGRVNRLFSKYAVATGIQFPNAKEYLKGPSFLIDMPLREGLCASSFTKDVCYDYFQLSDSRKTILVFGGSQGAFTINKLMKEVMASYRGDFSKIQILHFTGNEEESKKTAKYYEKLPVSATVKAFENNMGKAWKIADLVVGRAGANTLAEALEFGVPCILIPYPYATDDHQTKNAQFMANIIKGAIVCQEADLSPIPFSEKLLRLLEHSPQTLDSMRESINHYKLSSQQQDMCSLITKFIPSEE